jgi:hypothetical protein
MNIRINECIAGAAWFDAAQSGDITQRDGAGCNAGVHNRTPSWLVIDIVHDLASVRDI